MSERARVALRHVSQALLFANAALLVCEMAGAGARVSPALVLQGSCRSPPPNKTTVSANGLEPLVNTFSHDGPLASMDAYRRSFAGLRPLNAEEEQKLALLFRAGDARAGDRLVRSNLGFVISIAREYRRWGVPLEDLVQQGNLGLLKAAARFDPQRSCRLVTYASYWIRAEIRDYVMRGYRMVRLGTTKSERRALREYRRSRETDPGALARASGMREKAVERLMPLLTSHDSSLDESLEKGRSEGLCSPLPSPEDLLVDKQRRQAALRDIRAFVLELAPRDRQILEARWLTEEVVTLELLGARFGISKERVRQLEERVLVRLRERLQSLDAERPAA